MVESNTWHNIISVDITHIYVYQIHTPKLSLRLFTLSLDKDAFGVNKEDKDILIRIRVVI